MSRGILIVLDSVGIGATPDAAHYGDAGADTIGHVADVQDRSGRSLALPNLTRLGLGAACQLATGRTPPGLDTSRAPEGLYGCAAEISCAKDSQSGHWEIAGVPVYEPWGYFPEKTASFPQDLLDRLCAEAQLSGILGNKHASGTDIIREFGEEHLVTGKPICYTSTDSVFQIAAHEQTFGLERLYEVCRTARRLVDPYRVGRVIARPFVGTHARDFRRTANRHDYGVPPPAATLLDLARTARREVISLGKIGDLFSHRNTGCERTGPTNDAIFDELLSGVRSIADGGLVVANLVEFDTLYGHRRDPSGYALALEAFDRRLPELETLLRNDDLVVITGDHGCDPTWLGSDHTREYIPIVAFGEVTPGSVGMRGTFADIGASLADHLDIEPPDVGTSFCAVRRKMGTFPINPAATNGP